MSGEGVLPAPRAIRSGLDLTGEAISPEAARTYCCTDAGSIPGFGYDGGGFGPYRLCTGCGNVFGKTKARDGGA
jgi:uncharacterized membrane protein